MTSDEDWEQDCVQAVRERFVAIPEILRGWDLRIEAVRLVGSRPRTRLVVEALAEGVGTPREFAFELWGPVFQNAAGARDAPDDVAAIIAANVTEPG